MRTYSISRKVEISASAQDVFAGITNWPGQSQWMLGTSVKAVKHNGTGEGGTIIARTAIGPLGFDDPMTITKWNPPYECSVVHTGKIVRGTGSFVVTPLTDTTSYFIWTEDVQVPFGFLGAIGWHIAKIPFGFGVSWSLRRFKHWIEKNQAD